MMKRKLKTNTKKVPKAKRQTLAQAVLAELRAMRDAFTEAAKGGVAGFQTDFGPVYLKASTTPQLQKEQNATGNRRLARLGDMNTPWMTATGERMTLGQMELPHLVSCYALLLRKARQAGFAEGTTDKLSDTECVDRTEAQHAVAEALRREVVRRLSAREED